MIEVEMKARVKDLAAVERQLVEMGGTFVDEILKEDVYFRRKDSDSTSSSERYRLRRQKGRHSIVTFKDRIGPRGSGVRREIEFEVSDAHSFFLFTQRFEFEPFVVKRKRSRIYNVGRASVELNDMEHAGYFVEIEILVKDESNGAIETARDEVVRLFWDLGFGPYDMETRRYIDMIMENHPVQYRFVDDPGLDWPFEEMPLKA